MGKLLEQITIFFSVASMIVDTWNVFSYLLFAITGGGSVATFVNKFPPYVYIGLASVSILSLVFAIVRTIVRYNRWVKIQNDTTLLNILETLQTMHLLLGKLSNNLSGMKIDKQKLVTCALKYHRIVGIDSTQYKIIKQQKTEDAWNSVYKRTKKVYGYDIKDIITLTDMFADIGREMDKLHFGISRYKQDSEYQSLYSRLKEYELKLNLSDAAMVYNLDQALNLSYGIHSLNNLFIFLKREPQFIEQVPDMKILQMERSMTNKDSIYSIALLQLKRSITDDLIRVKL